MNFTDSQRHCIDITDRDLIVSAGAGAGKTAVLIERIFSLIAGGCPVDEMLIVTFSRAAASEMKERLSRRIRKALEEPETPVDLADLLRDQLYQMPRASISTIHSFCLSVITSHPDRVGLSPGFDLMSEEETRLLHREFFSRKIEEALENDDITARILRRLLDESDPINGAERVLSYVLSFHRFLDSLPFPEEYLALCRDLHAPDPDLEFSETAAGRLLGDFAREELGALLDEVKALLLIADGGIHDKFSNQYDHLRAMEEGIGDCCESSTMLDDLEGLLESLPFPRLSSARGEMSVNDERFKAGRTALSKYVKDIAKRLASLCGPIAREDFKSCCDTVMTLLNTVSTVWGTELFDWHLQNRRLTFSHLEKLALRILIDDEGNPSEIARLYRNAFTYVLVDEFQDTNRTQELLLRSISRPRSDELGGNRFVVGDVKQSIYEFRLAEPGLFLGLFNSSRPHDSSAVGFPDTRVTLPENFRSHPLLLAEFNAIFSLLMQEKTIGLDYADGHSFKAGRTPGEKPRQPAFNLALLPKVHEAESDEDEKDDISLEAEYVAETIQQLGPPWRDICILLRSTVGSTVDLVAALDARGIPSFTDSRLGFLTAVEVLEFQAILKTIHNPYDELSLLATLRGPAFRWNEEDLITLRFRNRRSFYIDLLRSIAKDEADSLNDKAVQFVSTLDRWQRESQSRPMVDLFSLLFDELSLIERASVRPGGNQRRLNLLYMLDRARQFDRFLVKGLGPFLKFLDDLIANDEDFAPPSPLPSDSDVVRIMTIHKSKGMQFPIVFLPFMGKKFNEINLSNSFLFDREFGVASKIRDKDSDIEEAPAIYEAIRQVRRRRERAEELRLLYVALTRAEEAVYASASFRKPLEELDAIYAQPASAQPGARQVLGAKRSVEWLFPYLRRRVDIPSGEGHLSATEGILTLDVYTEPIWRNVESSAPEKAAKDRTADPEAVVAFGSALTRIMEHASAPEAASLRAKISVTEAKRAYEATLDPETPALPRAMLPGEKQKRDFRIRPPQSGGADKGTATHRFLAHCDLVKLARAEVRLKGELQRLVEAQLLTPEQAALVTLEDIAVFLNSPLGKRLRRLNGKERREVPFTFRIDSDEVLPETPRRPIVMQGVADLLFREAEGWVLVDYKTDNCGTAGERVDALAASYSPQIGLYRLAVERTLREPVKESWLVFLGAGQQRLVPPAESLSIAWQKVVEAGAVYFAEAEKRTPNLRGV